MSPATDEVFFDSLRSEDSLGVVVRAHIHIEARLNQVLHALTPHPKHLPNLRYEQRVRLAVALGLNEEILQPLKELGDIRNAFGHRLDAALTDGMVNKLFNSFTESDRHTIRRAYAHTYMQLGEAETAVLDEADARVKFVVIAVTLDKYLILAEQEARSARAA